MNRWSKNSMAAIEGIHPHLKQILNGVLIDHDCAVLSGLRSLEEEQENEKKGVSWIDPVKSKHLKQVDGFAWAVDVVPCFNHQRLITTKTGFGLREAGLFGFFLAKVDEEARRYFAGQRLINREKWHLRFGMFWTPQDWFHIELVQEKGAS